MIGSVETCQGDLALQMMASLCLVPGRHRRNMVDCLAIARQRGPDVPFLELRG